MAIFLASMPFAASSPRQAWLTFVAAGIVLIIVGVILQQVPKRAAKSYALHQRPAIGAKERFDVENETRKTLAQIFGGLAFILASALTWIQIGDTQDSMALTENGQITDRYATAIEDLGNSDPTVRLGAIFSLERIAHDSDRDAVAVVQVLAAFIRMSSSPSSGVFLVAGERPQSREEINAAIAVITGVDLPIRTRLGCLKLTETNLSGVVLEDRSMTGLCLEGAIFNDAELNNTDFSGISLQNAHFRGTHLRGAKFAGANLNGADFSRADLKGADLSGALALTKAQVLASCFDKTTKLPPGITIDFDLDDGTANCEFSGPSPA